MPALTHGRVVNGFNAYPKLYNSCIPKKKNYCKKKVYHITGTIIPDKYINSNSCSSEKCRRTKCSTSNPKMRSNIMQRGIGDSISKNILNKKELNRKKLSKCKCKYFKLI